MDIEKAIIYSWHISSKCGARWEKGSITLPIPGSILRPDVQLFIEDFHIGYSIKIPKCQLESPYHIPTSNLVSFRIGHIPSGVLMRDFARALVKCRNLRSLSCGSDKYTCFPLEFAPGEVMPPLTKLHLKEYLWGRSFPYKASHWDFKQLEILDIIGLPVQSIASMDISSMKSLRVLKLDGGLTPQLLSAILLGLPQLEQLETRCDLPYFSLYRPPSSFYLSFFGDVCTHWTFDTIGESLRKLHSLRKLKIVKSGPHVIPVMFTGLSWEILRETCTLLETLELDLDIWDQEGLKDMASIFGNYVEVRTLLPPECPANSKIIAFVGARRHCEIPKAPASESTP
jgi:hypothetical protein